MKKIILSNIISGLSLITLVVFGTQYLMFKNTEPYQNLSMSIVNNPITGNENIEFVMIGRKVLQCSVDNAYAIAVNNRDETVILNEFVELYYRNIDIGDSVTNTWKIRRPEALTEGVWRVTMVGDWTCSSWIFEETRTRTYDNILLIVN
jgi:hypothetical protein